MAQQQLKSARKLDKVDPVWTRIRDEAELKKHGKTHEFYRYDGAGHGIWYWHRPLYRPEQAMDGWSKVLAFFGKHLAK